MSEVGGKVLHTQKLEVLRKILKFMMNEANADRVIIDFKKIIERVTAALRVSVSTFEKLRRN